MEKLMKATVLTVQRERERERNNEGDGGNDINNLQ